FSRYAGVPPVDGGAIRHAGWTIRTRVAGVRLPEGVDMPQELIPAASLQFAGLRSVYRRDGFGAELVAVMQPDPVTTIVEPGTGPEVVAAAPRDPRRHRRDNRRDYS